MVKRVRVVKNQGSEKCQDPDLFRASHRTASSQGSVTHFPLSHGCWIGHHHEKKELTVNDDHPILRYFHMPPQPPHILGKASISPLVTVLLRMILMVHTHAPSVRTTTRHQHRTAVHRLVVSSALVLGLLLCVPPRMLVVSAFTVRPRTTGPNSRSGTRTNPSTTTTTKTEILRFRPNPTFPQGCWHSIFAAATDPADAPASGCTIDCTQETVPIIPSLPDLLWRQYLCGAMIPAVLACSVSFGLLQHPLPAVAIAKTTPSHHQGNREISRNAPSPQSTTFFSVLQPTVASVRRSDHRASLLLASESATTSSSAQEEEEEPVDALEEVWTLVDKYYVNQATNANWKELRNKYRVPFVQAGNNVDAQMKVLSDLVETLGDKYSRTLTPAQYAEIQKFDLLGVGATLTPQEGRIVIGAPPLPGSSSDMAGLHVGDQILRVNGISTVGKTALDIVDQVSEQSDAKTLTFTVVPRQHAGDASYGHDVVLDRTLLSVQNPIRYKLDGDIGYIRVSEFNSLVLPKLEEALRAMSKNAQGYVLDLRHNTGGAFQSAIEISSLFLSDRVATFVVDNSGQRIPFKTTTSTTQTTPIVDPNIPIVVWIDGRSASASEVLASALHDNCRAVLAGSNSFGKGLIQAVYGLRNGGGLVLTVAKYETPSGQSIQGAGIAPDVPGHVSPTLLGMPISSDTSSTDWVDVKQRLRTCQAPSAL